MRAVSQGRVALCSLVPPSPKLSTRACLISLSWKGSRPTTSSGALRSICSVADAPGISPRPTRPSSATSSTMVRSANGACSPAALSSGGSPIAIGVTRIWVIFIAGAYFSATPGSHSEIAGT